uniref:Centromere protein K n=1 Tax=Sphaeramia orbicularis TaxID=375764 RepID=A0A673CBA6_9TELE
MSRPFLAYRLTGRKLLSSCSVCQHLLSSSVVVICRPLQKFQSSSSPKLQLRLTSNLVYSFFMMMSTKVNTKIKIQKMKVYQERLMECLGDILEKHVPLPQSETNKKKKNNPQEMNEDLISLNEILELLMNKVLNTPHDPYVTIDSTFWPPYIEMLLRYGIAIRHQENNFKIRLEPFY